MSERGSREQRFPNTVVFLLLHILLFVLLKGRHIARDPLTTLGELLTEHSSYQSPCRINADLELDKLLLCLFLLQRCSASALSVHLLPCKVLYCFSSL